VEGVGGLLCPISDEFWVIHLAKMLDLPVAIVARSGLGTINHTLLTIHAARCAGLQVAGVVINRYQIDGTEQREMELSESAAPHGDAEMAMFTNPQQIALHGQVPVLALVPEDPESSVEHARLGPDVRFAIDQVDWEGIISPQ
jgi:dethiobiotin synthetase